MRNRLNRNNARRWSNIITEGEFDNVITPDDEPLDHNAMRSIRRGRQQRKKNVMDGQYSFNFKVQSKNSRTYFNSVVFRVTRDYDGFWRTTLPNSTNEIEELLRKAISSRNNGDVLDIMLLYSDGDSPFRILMTKNIDEFINNVDPDSSVEMAFNSVMDAAGGKEEELAKSGGGL